MYKIIFSLITRVNISQRMLLYNKQYLSVGVEFHSIYEVELHSTTYKVTRIII